MTGRGALRAGWAGVEGVILDLSCPPKSAIQCSIDRHPTSSVSDASWISWVCDPPAPGSCVSRVRTATEAALEGAAAPAS